MVEACSPRTKSFLQTSPMRLNRRCSGKFVMWSLDSQYVQVNIIVDRSVYEPPLSDRSEGV